MAIKCPACKRDYDVTLFDFGREVECICGEKVVLGHKELHDRVLKKNKRGGLMANISFKVGNIYCYDCVIALKKFIGSLEGIKSIEMAGEDTVELSYDASSISERRVREIVTDSAEKLGFKIII